MLRKQCSIGVLTALTGLSRTDRRHYTEARRRAMPKVRAKTPTGINATMVITPRLVTINVTAVTTKEVETGLDVEQFFASGAAVSGVGRAGAGGANASTASMGSPDGTCSR